MSSPRRQTLTLSRTDVERLVTWEDALGMAEAAYIALARGEAQPFPTVREPVALGMVGLRGAFWPDRGALGVKVSGYFLANRDAGLESHQAVVVLLDPTTGQTRAIVDGNYVTWLRTAVAGAAGSRALARTDARRILVVGNGLQAEAQVRSHALLFADRQPEFLVHTPRGDAGATKAAAFGARLAAHGIRVEAAPELDRALAAADVVITATPSTEPLFPAGWVAPGTHVTAVGADARGKRELDDKLVSASRLIADDRVQSHRFGEGQGLSDAAAARTATLGEVLAGIGVGREDDREVTIFDTTGLGLHDVAAAALALERALEHGVGTSVSF